MTFRLELDLDVVKLYLQTQDEVLNPIDWKDEQADRHDQYLEMVRQILCFHWRIEWRMVH